MHPNFILQLDFTWEGEKKSKRPYIEFYFDELKPATECADSLIKSLGTKPYFYETDDIYGVYIYAFWERDFETKDGETVEKIQYKRILVKYPGEDFYLVPSNDRFYTLERKIQR